MLVINTENGVTRLTLDRADRGNALSPALVDQLTQAVLMACSDEAVHTLVLTAAGPHFCTGFDLSDLDDCSDGDLLLRFVRIETLLAAIWHAPIHTVVLAQGRCWGAGADLFAACERRMITSDGNFRFPGAGFGLVLGSRRLAQRVGSEAARRWVIEGREISADIALSHGLASEMYSSDPGDAILAQAARVDRLTASRLRAVTRDNRSDADLAELVRSAAAPGLRNRIFEYRKALRANAAKQNGS